MYVLICHTRFERLDGKSLIRILDIYESCSEPLILLLNGSLGRCSTDQRLAKVLVCLLLARKCYTKNLLNYLKLLIE